MLVAGCQPSRLLVFGVVMGVGTWSCQVCWSSGLSIIKVAGWVSRMLAFKVMVLKVLDMWNIVVCWDCL